jgi:hypothetical protein
MVNTKTPECVHCFGKNWTKIAQIGAKMVSGVIVGVFLWQCGHGLPHADPSEMKSGCGRVIAATEEEMAKEGQI